MYNPQPPFPDRKFVMERLRELATQCSQRRRSMACLAVKLARLREVNLAFGYHVGDAVLDEFTARIRHILRDEDCFVRIGNDEFALILPFLLNDAHATLAISKVTELATQPYNIEGLKLTVKAIIGHANLHTSDGDLDTMVRQAQTALSYAEKAGVSHQPYGSLVKETPAADLLLENALRDAITNGELVMHYQPKIRLATGTVCGAEALVRWISPERGFIPPNAFIPVAENTGMIVDLTNWTLNTSLRQFSKHAMARQMGNISVNISATLLHDLQLVDIVANALSTWAVEPRHLTLEVTESAVMKDPERSLETLTRLRDMGTTVSIDDFGTGYSSLAYLRRLPVGELKIDKSFVTHLVSDTGNRSIVQSIIDLSHNFHLKVVAEGIEDERTCDFLVALECDCGQGFYIARPMPIDRLCKWLEQAGKQDDAPQPPSQSPPMA